MAQNVLIMAGGTGGHIFPGLAVAEALRANNAKVSWLGTPHGLENQLVSKANIPIHHVKVTALRGKGLLGWLKAPFKVLAAVLQARNELRRIRPGCVLSMGGYVAGPGGLAARWMGIPLVVHEQNRKPGLTNRWLAKWAQRVCVGFAGTFPDSLRTHLSGNPVRQTIRAVEVPAQRYAERQGALNILVIGGSLGARFLNTKVPELVSRLDIEQRPNIVHQSGQRGIAEAQDAYSQHEVKAEVKAFIDDMAAAYAWADLVICRAGALTVSELMASGVASVLVPFPHAVDDHQYANCQTLQEVNAALLIRESEWNQDVLVKQLQHWGQHRDELLAMAQAARELDPGDAALDVAKLCLEVANERR